MVAIVTGTGLGLERGSANVLGSRGQVGDSTFGTAGENVTINAATGNLVINRTDEILIGEGLDDVISRSYNSLGPGTDDNGDNWTLNVQRHVGNLTGTANTAGSTVTLYDSDGSDVVYTYDTVSGKYLSTRGAGATDTLSFASNVWTAVDGDTQVTDKYDALNGGRITSSTDANGNALTFTYTGALLTRVTDQDGEHTDFTWSGNNVTSIVTTKADATTLTRTRYTYDTSNRLSTVITDLTPNDNSIADANDFITTYTYDGTSNRVASISQTGGAQVSFAYTLVGSAYRVTSFTQAVASGVTRTTTLSYNTATGVTTITDPLGGVTAMTYDANGNLIRLDMPAAASGAPVQSYFYTYTAAGDVASATDAAGNITSYAYDANGNLNYMVDALGDTTTWTYSATNQILTKSVYTVPPQGAPVLPVLGGGGGGGSNSAPTATGDTIHVLAGIGSSLTFDPRGNDTDPDGDFLTIISVSAPAHGTATIVNGGTSITYIRTAGGLGSDSLTYTISDGHGHTSTATIAISGGSMSADSSHEILATAPVTTRYVYDTAGNLRFSVSAMGEVTEYDYDTHGQLGSKIVYRANTYSLTGLGPNDPIALSSMTAWVSGITDKSTVERTDTAYDFRGNVSTVTTYTAASTAGAGLTTSPYTTVTYVYDQHGSLLTRLTSGESLTETYTYDGLARLKTSLDLNSNTTTYTYNDGSNNVVTTMSGSGLTQTSVYDLADELISTTQSGTGYDGTSPATETDTAHYAYDADGRLRMVTDAVGNKTYYLYDGVGRKIADIAADGSITEYRYNAANLLVSTTGYATKLTSTQLASLVDVSGNPANIALSTVRPAGVAADVWSWRVYDSANRLIETIGDDGSVTAMYYDGMSNLIATVSCAGVLSSTTLTGFQTTPPTAIVLPATSATTDNLTRNFYDNDGRLVGTLDGDGFLTQTIYNPAGEKTDVISYAAATTVSLRQTGSFGALLASVGTPSLDLHTRYVFNDEGLLQYTIDAQLNVTENDYDAAGHILHTIRYGAPIDGTGPFTAAYVAGRIAALGLAGNTATRTTWFVYDTGGRLSYTIDANGNVVSHGFDAAGNDYSTLRLATPMSITTDQSLSAMTTWLSAHGSDAGNRYEYRVRDDFGRVVYTIDGETYITKTIYDADGRVTGTIKFASPYTTVGHAPTAAGVTTLIGSVIPSTAEQTSTVYDVDGRVGDTYDGNGIRTHYAYDALGRVTDVTRAYGTADAATVHTTYDSVGRVASATAGYGTTEASTTSYLYDGFGNVASMTDGNGNVTTYVHDAMGRERSVTVPLTATTTATTSYLYDGFGNLLMTTDPLGNKTYDFYDNLDHKVLTIDGEGYATKTVYTVFGEVASVTRYATKVTGTITPGLQPTLTTSASDETTGFVHDHDGQITGQTDAEMHTEGFGYDAFGDKTSFINEMGVTTTYAYDHRGLVVSETLPEASVRNDGTTEAGTVTNAYTYDAFGNRTKMVEASGLTEQRTTTYTYDNGNRLLTTAGDMVTVYTSDTTGVAVTPTTTNKYDNRGNLIEQDDPTGARTLYYYDHLDRRVASIGPTGVASAWTYDKNGNATAEKVYATLVSPLPATPGGTFTPPATSTFDRETDYAYDKANRLITTTVSGVTTGSYNTTTGTYSTSSAAIVLTNYYDADNNLIAQTDGRTNAAWYYYDKRGDKVAQVDQEGYLTTYALDWDGNVTTETRYATALTSLPAVPPTGVAPTGTSNAADRITNFTYDHMGRRLTEQRLNVAVSSVNAATGALTTTTATAIVTYVYNQLGEVTQKTQATGDYVTYGYDTMGRQTSETDSAFTDYTGASVNTTTVRSYDGLNDLTRSVENGTRVTQYSYGAGGLLAIRVDADGNSTHYRYDAAGRQTDTTHSRTNSAGTSAIEGAFTVYNAAGQVVQSYQAVQSGSTWTHGDTTAMTYNAFGQILTKGVNGGTQETFVYDNAGRMTQTNSGDGTVKLYLYDADGNQTLEVAATGNLATGSWSAMTMPAAISLLSGTGAFGSVDVQGMAATAVAYDRRGLATKTIEYQRETSIGSTGAYVASTLTLQRAYDAFGEVVTDTDAKGKTTTYAYGTTGKVLSTTLPAVSYTDDTGVAHAGVAPVSYTYYDASGRVVGTRDADGNLITRLLLAGSGYDGADAITVEEFHPDGGIFAYGYDVNRDMIKQSVNGIVGTGEVDEVFAYDAMDRMTSDTHPTRAAGSPGNTTGSAQTLIDYYVYDQLGERIKHYNNFYGSTVTETTDYDDEGRVIKTANMDGYAIGYAYSWSSGAVTSGMGAFGGWVKTTTQYDLVGGTLRSESETDDYFGHVVAKANYGGETFTYAFDAAGHLVSSTNSMSAMGDQVTYAYFNTGNLAKQTSGYVYGDIFTHDAIGEADDTIQTFAYDADGNRTLETAVLVLYDTQTRTTGDGGDIIYTHLNSSNTVLEDEVATYDDDGRLLTVNDSDGITTGSYSSITTLINGIDTMSVGYAYDLNGNIRNMQSTYYLLTNTGTQATTTTSENYWYKYDSMNRFVVTMGALSGGVISGGSTGSTITYNKDGSRATMTDATETDTYTYTTDGYLASTSISLGIFSPESATYAYDAMGRVTEYTEIDSSGNTAEHRYNIVYDHASLLQSDVTVTRPGGTVSTQTSTYSYIGLGTYNSTLQMYNLDGTYQGGMVTDVKTTVVSGSTTTKPETQYLYDWANGDGPTQLEILYHADTTHTPPSTLFTTNYGYDAEANLVAISIQDGKPRTVSFTDDAAGEILKRDEQQTSGATSNPHEIHYYFNNMQIGDISNNGTSDTDYAVSIGQHETAAGTGVFRNGATGGTSYANFDQSYDPINGDSGASTGTSYTVSAGDTLQSIAFSVFGDASLWYVIADANGLSNGDTLTAGMTLIIPNKVENVHNDSTTFKPVDPNTIIGNVSPTIPKQKHTPCGVFGQILQAIVTVVVSYFVGPVLGDVVGQLFGMAIGNQSGFNWKELGMSAVAALVPPGLQEIGLAIDTGIDVVDAALNAVLANAVTQGIGVATGLQKSFDWAGVAAAGVAAGVTTGVGDLIKGNLQTGGDWDTGNDTLNGMIYKGITGAAGMLAGAATTSLIKGTDFGDNIVSALPSFISNTVGGAIAGALTGGTDQSTGGTVANGGSGGNGGGFIQSVGHFLDDVFGDDDNQSFVPPGAGQLTAKDPVLTLDPGAITFTVPKLNYDYVAQPGDNISTVLGTSSPGAIGAFMQANGLTSSTIVAGKTYVIPDPSSYNDPGAAQLGQGALNTDNARLAEIANERAQLQASYDALNRQISTAFDPSNFKLTLGDHDWSSSNPDNWQGGSIGSPPPSSSPPAASSNSGGISGMLNTINQDVHSQSFIGGLRSWGQSFQKSGDTTSEAATIVTVGGAVTGQPEVVALGGAGLVVGDIFSDIGTLMVTGADMLSGDTDAARKDSEAGLLGHVVPPGVDTKPMVNQIDRTIDATKGYLGF